MIDLQKLSTLFDDKHLVRKYLARFAMDMPALIGLMRDAYLQKQWGALSIHAHTFKTQLQYVNQTEAAGIAHDLEKESANASPDEARIEQYIASLELSLGALLREIQALSE